jgi:prephenate dehydratase
MIRIGCLGPKGTFSDEAARLYTKSKKNIERKYYNSIPDLLYAVNSGEICEAVVPIENSIEGAVNPTLDMLAFEVDLKITSEIVLEINQNLLVLKGSKAEDIKVITSISQALGQCRKYTTEHFPDVIIKPVDSTAGAAEDVAAGLPGAAAIASMAAAEAYNLDIIAEKIQDNDNNLTRFVTVSRDDTNSTGNDKTSIVFSTDDKPGSLYRILDIFSLWDINMSKIESRPVKNRLGRYVFFIDIKGHYRDEDVTDALTMVKRKTSFYKFLGSYPEYQG